MTDKIIHIDALEVARKFGYLIAGKGKFSGLEFAKTEWKENAPLCPDDSNGEDWEDYTSVAH